MDPKLEAMLTTIMAKTGCLDDIKIKLDEVSDRVARLEVKRRTHTSEIEVDQPRREPRLVPIAPISTLIARPIETIGDQSNFFMKEVLNEFSTEIFILPEALKLDSLPISIYIADPSLAEEYEKYEDEMHEEDSYMIEVESQVEKIVIELSYKEERIIDAIDATKSSYCSDNTIDHIEMIICHGRSEVNSSTKVQAPGSNFPATFPFFLSAGSGNHRASPAAAPPPPRLLAACRHQRASASSSSAPRRSVQPPAAFSAVSPRAPERNPRLPERRRPCDCRRTRLRAGRSLSAQPPSGASAARGSRLPHGFPRSRSAALLPARALARVRASPLRAPISVGVASGASSAGAASAATPAPAPTAPLARRQRHSLPGVGPACAPAYARPRA
ncbi:hypothetical protein AXF42_Ash003135 [Apostasia shenzhenica]|uniref:Uncharacterized protein n=1 Tax=Apostasia shenzhenica TaxID=1088818 RepID=A0A2I0BFA9_9ASPA|nr:hypothetical protein AXF42_Ash003135 [Apostasia shenzhenica]